jgi:hypothetical protein
MCKQLLAALLEIPRKPFEKAHGFGGEDTAIGFGDRSGDLNGFQLGFGHNLSQYQVSSIAAAAPIQ